MIVKDNINDDLAQGIMIITMLLNGILEGIDNSSLNSRLLVCIDSKPQNMTVSLVALHILVSLQKKIQVLKNEDASYEILLRKCLNKKVPLTSSMNNCLLHIGNGCRTQ